MEDQEMPPGFRFYPTEQELVSFYLRNQLEGTRLQELHQVIPVLDIYELEPSQLPSVAGERCRGDTEQWFFFTPRQEREARGGRPNRTTGSGYWKATGSPSYVYSSNGKVIGVKKTMVFYKGKAPAGRKTKWKMNEYRAIQVAMTNNDTSSSSSQPPVPELRREYSLCRIYVVSGTFGAYDRRPLEEAQEQLLLPSDHVPYSSSNGQGHGGPPAEGTSSAGVAGMEMADYANDELEPSFFDWPEEFDWP